VFTRAYIEPIKLCPQPHILRIAAASR